MSVFNAVKTSFFTRNSAIGGYGGKIFSCLGIVDGKRLDRLVIWAYSARYVTGLEVTLSNGENKMVGKREGEAHELYVGKDKLTSIKIQEEKKEDKTIVGHIRIQTDSGKTLQVNRQNEVMPVKTIDVGSGICFGVFGSCGSDVDSIGFAMLRPVRDCMMTDIYCPGLAKVKPSFEEYEIIQETFKNNTGEKQTFNTSASLTLVDKSDWTAEGHVDFATKVKAGIPFFVDGELKTKVGFALAQTWGTSTSKTKSWAWPIVCPPRMMVKAKASINRRTFDLDYTANMAYHLNNGEIFKIPVKGKFEHADTDDAVITIVQYPL